MKIKYFLVVSLLYVEVAKAQHHITVDTGTFILHAFENPVGRETYHSIYRGNKIFYHTALNMLERGTKKFINANMTFSKHFEPISFGLEGKDGSNDFNTTIKVAGQNALIKTSDTNFTCKISLNHFFVNGYAPVVLQQTLVQYWLKNGKPGSIQLLPQGTAQVDKEGVDSFMLKGKKILLDRYVIHGLVWGNEFLWVDKNCRIVGLVTNNETNDKTEAIREGYEPLLKTMVGKTALYGSRKLFADLGTKHKFGRITIIGAQLIDVNTGQIVKNCTINIKENRIVAIGRSGRLKIPRGTRIIDARGKTVIPGLWDMHAHYGQAEWGPAYLAAGVTVIRDCTDEFEYANPVKKLIDAGKGIGPQIIKAGLIDGKAPGALGIVQVENSTEAIAAVNRFAKNGYAQIKIFSKVKPEMVKVICKEAHRLGLSVTGHIPDGMTLQAGVDSGMDMVNHIYYVYGMMKYNKDHSVNFEDSVNVSAIQFIKNHHVVIDPTLGGMEMALRSKMDNFSDIEPAFKTLPIQLQNRFIHTGMSVTQAEKYKPMFQSMQKMVKVLNDAGVPIVAGSDTGIPGLSLERELELYVNAGFSPLQALQSATIVPAKAMQMDSTFGTITKGKCADLVILNANPIENISNLRLIYKVIHNGRVYAPHELRKLAGFSK